MHTHTHTHRKTPICIWCEDNIQISGWTDEIHGAIGCANRKTYQHYNVFLLFFVYFSYEYVVVSVNTLSVLGASVVMSGKNYPKKK